MMARSTLWVVAAMLIVASTAAGQTNVQRFERRLEQIEQEQRLAARTEVPAEQRARVEYGGYHSFNFFVIDDIDQKAHILRQNTLTGFARVNLDGVHEFYFRGHMTYNDWDEDDSVDNKFGGHGDDWVEPTLDRGWYRFDLARSVEVREGREIDGNFMLQSGRQLVHWANGLTLSWEIDGAQITVSRGDLSLQTVAGVTRNSTTDIDSSRPGFSGDTSRGIFGGMLVWDASPRHKLFIYGLMQRDYNDDEVLFVDVAGTPGDRSDDLTTKFDYDSFYIGLGSKGAIGDRVVYGVELVYEGGEGLSNSFVPSTLAPVLQTHEDINAFAADVRLDYLFTDANRTRVSAEMVIATGDTDRLSTSTTFAGNKSGTDDHAFNAFGRINTGLAFNPDVSNLLMLRIGASMFPLPNSELMRRFQVGVNVFIFNKLNRSAPIDEATSHDMYLGFEPDIFANWQVNSDVTISMRYGVFFPGTGIESDHDSRHFFFSGVTIAF